MIRSQLFPPSRRLNLALALAQRSIFIAGALVAVGCSSSAPPTTNAIIPTTGLVVLSSDYTSTSVSLVDPDDARRGPRSLHRFEHRAAGAVAGAVGRRGAADRAAGGR